MTLRVRAGLVMAIVTLFHAPLLTKPLFDSDEAIYASIAALLNAGGRLYAEGGVDNKFPGIYYAYAAVFRVFGPYAMGAVHALAIAVVLATCLLLAKLARELGGERAGLLAAAFYGVLTTFYYPKMLAANTEIFMTLPLAASVLLSLPAKTRDAPRGLDLFLAGALIGVATLFRQLAALNLVLSSLAPVAFGPRTLRRWLAALLPGLGFAFVFGVLFGAYAVNGNLPSFFQWAVRAATTRYLTRGWEYVFPAAAELSMLAVMIVPVALSAVRGRTFRQRSRPEQMVFLWLGLGVVAIVFLWRFHPHYVIHIVAPLSVLAGLELDALLGSARARVGRIAALVVLIEAAVFFVLAFVLEPVAGGTYPPRPDYPQVAEYVQNTTHDGERIFIWGAYAPIYVLSGRLPASRFVGFMRGCPRYPDSPLSRCWDGGAEVWPLLEQDLETTPPELILDTAAANYGDFGLYPMKDVPRLAELVASRYVEERVVDGVRIYRRSKSPL